MSRTFEEMASEEVDVLYSGALFLSAGNTVAAERLLLSSVTGAFREYATQPPGADFGRWLEARMVRAFLRLPAADPTSETDVEAGPSAGGGWVGRPGDGLNAIRAVTGRFSAPARAALWLVVVQRRRYIEVADLLGVDRTDVWEWLREGASLMHAAAPDSSRPRGTGAEGGGG